MAQATQDPKIDIAGDLADVNIATLHLLKDRPELFDLAAIGALAAVVAMVVEVRGAAILCQMLDAARP